MARFAQQLQVRPGQRDLRIRDVVRRQRDLVVHFERLLLRSGLDDPTLQAALAQVAFGFGERLPALPPDPRSVE